MHVIFEEVSQHISKAMEYVVGYSTQIFQVVDLFGLNLSDWVSVQHIRLNRGTWFILYFSSSLKCCLETETPHIYRQATIRNPALIY